MKALKTFTFVLSISLSSMTLNSCESGKQDGKADTDAETPFNKDTRDMADTSSVENSTK